MANEQKKDLTKMKGDDRVAEALRQLGINPEHAGSLRYTIWAPQRANEAEHADDPVAFKGLYAGYKLITKEIGGKMSTFGAFMFTDCTPPPKTGGGFIVMNKILIDEVARLLPGTECVVVYHSSAKNVHGGQTHDVRVLLARESDRKDHVANKLLPPMNADVQALLTAGTGVDEIDEKNF